MLLERGPGPRRERDPLGGIGDAAREVERQGAPHEELLEERLEPRALAPPARLERDAARAHHAEVQIRRQAARRVSRRVVAIGVVRGQRPADERAQAALGLGVPPGVPSTARHGVIDGARRDERAIAAASAFARSTAGKGRSIMDFDPVTDYWMQERPDHLVEFHVTLPLKTPTPITKFLTFGSPIPNFSSILSLTTKSR